MSRATKVSVKRLQADTAPPAPSGKCFIKRRTEEGFEGKGTLNTHNYIKILLNLYMETRRKSGKYFPNVEESIKII